MLKVVGIGSPPNRLCVAFRQLTNQRLLFCGPHDELFSFGVGVGYATRAKMGISEKHSAHQRFSAHVVMTYL